MASGGPEGPARLKVKRATKLGTLTRKLKRAEQLMGDNEPSSLLRIVVSEIKIAISAVEQANDHYIDSLTDDGAMESASNWFVEAEDTASACLLEVSRYLDPDNSATNPPSNTSSPVTPIPAVANTVDAWIDRLDPAIETVIASTSQSVTANEVLLRAMFERDAPAVEMTKFDGSALKWPTFIQRFYEHVHKQPFFTDFRRMTILESHLEGQASMVLGGLGGNAKCYAVALQTLKRRFAHPNIVARAFLCRVTQGSQLPDNDRQSLELYQLAVRDCVVTLEMMAYDSDLYSCENIRLASTRLPPRMRDRWGEHCHRTREIHKREPDMNDLSTWLSDRVAGLFDPVLTPENLTRTPPPRSRLPPRATFATMETESFDRQTPAPSYRSGCPACKADHPLYRCPEYKALSADHRINLVRASRLCVNCLSPGHGYMTCQKPTCKVPRCGRKHHTSLHYNHRLAYPDADPRFSRRSSSNPVRIQRAPPGFAPPAQSAQDHVPAIDSAEQNADEPDNPLCGATRATEPRRTRVFLQILPVRLTSPTGQTCTTFALLDNGSQTTLIKSDLASDLGLDGPTEELVLNTVADQEVRHQSKRVRFTVSSIEEDEIPWAWTTPVLNLPAQRFWLDDSDQRELSALAGHRFTNVNSSEIGLLIGANAPDAILPTEIRRGLPGKPVAVKSGLGWTILGVAGGSYRNFTDSPTPVLVTQNYSMDDLHGLLTKFWSTETFGCAFEGQQAYSVEDRNALVSLQTKTRIINDRYEVPMLWRDLDPHLPNNYIVALRRFKSLQNRFRQDPERFHRYKGVIHAHLDSGYARRMTPQEIRRISPVTNYLPHHDVYNPNKPGKVRVVQDAAAKYKGTCINDHLVTGPDLLNSLVKVLVNFRGGVIGLAADIEAMFHRVLVNEADRDALRFLWSDDVQAETPDVYQMCVHIFGAKSSPTCAEYAVRRTAEDNRSRFSNVTIETVFRNFYVDDMVTSQQSTSEAVALARELIELLRCGGFRLTKWASNSREVLTALPTTELARQDINLDLDDMAVERILGMRWDTNNDKLTFRTITPEHALTKRGLLKTIATLFDPLGFLTPFVFIAKRLLQEIWRLKLGWDENLPDLILSRWKSWLADLENVSRFELSRCYSPDLWTSTEVHLHTFADASEAGFGAVVYLRIVSTAGIISTSFVMSKNRNAPIKPLTIPRLELQAAVLATRLTAMIRDGFQHTIHACHFWSDSTTVLAYIKNTSRRFQTFTANRVAEILSLSEADQWHFVPTHLNPADDCSRGLPATHVVNPGHRWLNGPSFLAEPVHAWPPVIATPLTAEDPELKPDVPVVAAIAETRTNHFLNVDRYSRLNKLRRVTAWALRFVHNCKVATGNTQRPYRPIFRDQLSTIELENALLLWVMKAQSDRYHAEITALRDGNPIDNSSPLLRLTPFLQDGLLRVGGRLERAPVAYDARHQLLLPRDHHVTDLIIAQSHEKVGHHGQEQVLAYLRRRYWIPQARVPVRRLVRSCVICHRRRVLPNNPMMSPLPSTRMALYEPPFSSCGVDYYGPVSVIRGRGTEKRWVCLFTCMTTRAIHLEVARNLEADSFILAIKRFAARRGCPRVVTSDNGTNFRGAQRELAEAVARIDHRKIADSLSPNNIEWRYNPPYGPHFGGVWERLVRSVKTTMRVVLGSGTYQEDVFHTALVETEAIINSRPLTAVSDDPKDLEPITPNHFLIGRPDPEIPPTTVTIDGTHRKRWRHAQKISDHVWQRFRSEYLPLLAPRAKWLRPVRAIAPNDLVLIAEDNSPKYKWPMGRALRQLPGKDGKVRVVELLTPSGVLTRPVSRLCLLEAATE